ncbi:HutD/Ves family protein [Pandoraea sp. PE-S2T-3]|uniref:HutD/Ves family protein n=1 Tax=Pandoraea sp. PE-S2T-3 TaxID=1986993 RepID=UPI000B3F8C67|nr:HutD family protein [Pandoraea sp. PE-S2T-3]
MKVQVLGPADFRKMPWKNGLGVTIELAVARRSGEDGFDWRISTATVATAGPFSVFAGIDRSLAIVRGGSLTLSVEGRDDVTLTTQTSPYAFGGELAVSSTPVLESEGVPIDDFNVMTRRSEWQHTLVQHRLTDDVVTWALPAQADSVAFLYCAAGDGGVSVALANGEVVNVPSGHALRLDQIDAPACQLRAVGPSSDVFLTCVTRLHG